MVEKASVTSKSKKKVAAEKKAVVTIRQIRSPIGRPFDQRQTLVGLGLNKLHRVSVLEDTAAVRGMIDKVAHLISVESDV